MKKILLITSFVITLLMSGCSQKIYSVSNIGDASYFNAYQMSWFETTKETANKTLVFTSLVNIDNFDESSTFGRIYSDLMITQLEQEGWSIIDYRGQEIVTANKTGEFYLNRSKLKLIPHDASVFVGTYGEYKEGLLLNLRILRMEDNQVLTTSSILLRDKEALAMSKPDTCKDLSCYESRSTYAIRVVKDDCSTNNSCAGVK